MGVPESVRSPEGLPLSLLRTRLQPARPVMLHVGKCQIVSLPKAAVRQLQLSACAPESAVGLLPPIPVCAQ